MVDDVVVRAAGLGKKYIIGHQAEREDYATLRDVIARNVRNFWRTGTDLVRGRPNVVGDELEEFWALRNIDFEIKRGEVVGVVGRNGAGKSTLLKVLSRITEPTEGRVEIRGRVASLLEVGTGFHPELTGRENIYLNGAVLGMTHAEIRRRFDEIVAFAEIERFLDTPVKRYSSGMYVRLAFAVAAHLEPEILIVDEVLAVGDAEFQKKCLGKMGEVASHGRTVLFVSHNMANVASLCNSGMLLVNGQITSIAPINQVIAQYANSTHTRANTEQPGLLFSRAAQEMIGEAAVTGVLMLDGIGNPATVVQSFNKVTFRITVSSTVNSALFSIFLYIFDQLGVVIAKFESDPRSTPLPSGSGEFSVDCVLEMLPLIPGDYKLGVGIARYGSHAVAFEESAGRFAVSLASDPRVNMSPWAEGFVATKHTWRAHDPDIQRQIGAAALGSFSAKSPAE